MLISEIHESNKIILKLLDIDTRVLTSDYLEIVELHRMLKPLGAARHRRLLGNIDYLEEQLTDFVNYAFNPDADIAAIKKSARAMLKGLDKIKKEIP